MSVPIFEPFYFDPTAFMSGQTQSKLWLCQKLEAKLFGLDQERDPKVVWILGGWYGLTAFLLQSRQRMAISKVVVFDLDPQAVKGALILNESSLNLGTFEAHVADVTELDYDAYGPRPDIVINTSIEHIPNRAWFDLIPKGTMTVLQSNNMQHADHVFAHENVDELQKDFPLGSLLFTGELPFDYGDWAFKRLMTVGYKL